LSVHWFFLSLALSLTFAKGTAPHHPRSGFSSKNQLRRQFAPVSVAG
jgi:hypothetical protein